MNTNYCHLTPLTYEEKVEMYMKLDKREIIDMLIEANNVIDKLTTRPQIVNVPFVDSRKVCTSWDNCSNPHRDCINCPLRYTQDSITITNNFNG